MFDDDFEEEEFDPKKRKEKVENMPIYKKGWEIYELAHHIIETIPEDDEMLDHIRQNMMQDVTMLCPKIAGAEGGDLYDLRMENAAIIRKCARDLLTSTSGLKMMGYKDTQYTQLLRGAIEEFRLLFIDWVAGFDEWNYIIDRWGLFNPPGVGAHDKDPDDNIPPSEF